MRPRAHPRQFHATSFGTCLDLEELAAEASGGEVFAQAGRDTSYEDDPTASISNVMRMGVCR